MLQPEKGGDERTCRDSTFDVLCQFPALFQILRIVKTMLLASKCRRRRVRYDRALWFTRSGVRCPRR